MVLSDGMQNYREVDIRSMPREKVVVLLYEKMVRDLEQAGEAVASGDRGLAVDRVSHSQRILTELNQALDPDHDPALAENLASLYEFLNHQHHLFLIDRDPVRLEDCRRVIGPLLDAWRQAAVTADGSRDETIRPDEASSGLFSVSA